MKSRRKNEQVEKGAKGKPPPVSTRPIPWDIGAGGAANRRGLIVESRGDTDPVTGKTVNPNARIGVRRETWVDRYERKEMLTAAQANAARHLRACAEGQAAQDPLAALRIDRRPGGSDPQAAALDARRAYHRLWALLPRYSRPIVERVVLEDRPIRSLCRNGQQQARQLGRLRRGLDFLCHNIDAGERR